MSWKRLPGTLVTLPCCSQSWWGWHGRVLEAAEEKKPWGQGWHWVFLKGVPVQGEARGPSARGGEMAKEQGQELGTMPAEQRVPDAT